MHVIRSWSFLNLMFLLRNVRWKLVLWKNRNVILFIDSCTTHNSFPLMDPMMVIIPFSFFRRHDFSFPANETRYHKIFKAFLQTFCCSEAFVRHFHESRIPKMSALDVSHLKQQHNAGELFPKSEKGDMLDEDVPFSVAWYDNVMFNEFIEHWKYNNESQCRLDTIDTPTSSQQ